MISSPLHPIIMPSYSEKSLSTILIGELNALLWVSWFGVTFYLITRVFQLFKLWAQGNRIPGPPCPSFFGHSKLINGPTTPQQNLSSVLSMSHKKYGSVVKLWLGPTQLLVSITEPALIKEMLLKAKDKLPLSGKTFRLAFGPSSLFASSFDEVQKKRELLATELDGKLLNIEKTVLMDIENVISKWQDATAMGTLDCTQVSQYLAFSMIGATLFGDKFLTWSDANAYKDILTKIAKEACFWASYGVTPFWKWGFWRYKCLCTSLKQLTEEIIQSCSQSNKQYSHYKKASSAAESDGSCPSGLVTSDKMLQDLSDCLITGEQPCGNVMGLMFHGGLTTAGLIGNMLAWLVKVPDLQDKIYSEIIIARKESQKQEQLNVDKMFLLLATIYESSRILPAAPLLQRCSLNQDLTLETGVTIPAGAIVVVPVQLVQTDCPSWGSDADQFNPKRFLLNAQKGSAEGLNSVLSSLISEEQNGKATYLPFGFGSRACVGQKFVVLGVATLFAYLLENYEIRLQAGSEDEPKPKMSDCILQLLPSPKIVFTRRDVKKAEGPSEDK